MWDHGNVPCYIDKTAKLATSVNDLVLSKSFDNGMICASEQAVLVDKDIYKEFEDLMRKAGCYFVSEEEKKKLSDSMFEYTEEYGFKLKSHVPGQSPYKIAKDAGFEVPQDTKVLVVYEEGIGEKYPFSKEKLSPVLTYYIVKDAEEGINKAEKLLEFGGLGHSAVIHSEDNDTILKFSETMKAGRIIVNSPSTHGAIGDIYNTNMPSLTLGCGSFGGNSTTANVSSVNLINIKRVAKRRVNMQWFKVPEKIYFEAGSIAYLEKMPDIERAFIVTDPGMVKLGYVDKILYHLRKRSQYVHSEIFSEVESDPSFDTIKKGVAAMNNFKPDVIIAVGGGSPMDAAKGISEEAREKMASGVYYVAGIDSGSTSTDVVILDQDGKIKSTMIIPTGGGATMSAEKSLELAVEKAGIKKEEIVRIDTTGYGRAYIDSGDDSITEITCHAKGAHYLNPNVRTVIDIGGQDIKAISIDENGAVKNFLMNDKCAAGTGRFLEMMARTLGLSLEEMSTRGLKWKNNVVISSMCTVFAESEVVSLVAQNKDVADIIHGLNVSVASKVGALAARLGQNNPGEYMMTGGVAQNQGIVEALEEKLGAKLYICDEAQLCGALGAALFAYEKCQAAK